MGLTENVRRIRKKKGWSQKELGDKLLMVGHYKILEAKLTRTYFEIKFKSEENNSALISHTMTDEEFADAKKVIKIIHPAVSIIK